MTKEWHKRTWNCCFFRVQISSQRLPLVCTAARGSSVLGRLLPELLYEKEPVSACIRGCWLCLFKNKTKLKWIFLLQQHCFVTKNTEAQFSEEVVDLGDESMRSYS